MRPQMTSHIPCQSYKACSTRLFNSNVQHKKRSALQHWYLVSGGTKAEMYSMIRPIMVYLTQGKYLLLGDGTEPRIDRAMHPVLCYLTVTRTWQRLPAFVL